MTLDKAIEILKAIIQTGEYEGSPDDSDAVILGIEALKRIETMRGYCSPGSGSILPGETEGVPSKRVIFHSPKLKRILKGLK